MIYNRHCLTFLQFWQNNCLNAGEQAGSGVDATCLAKVKCGDRRS